MTVKQRISEDGERKLCTGALHPEGGEWLPLDQFHLLKSGRQAGKYQFECKRCWRNRQGRDADNGLVPITDVWPYIMRLRAQLGSNRAICHRLGVPETTISSWKSRKQKNIRGNLFSAIKKLAADVDTELDGFRRVGEAEIVEAEPLGSVLRKFCADWLKERPNFHVAYGSGSEFYSPVQWLADMAHTSPRRISGLCNGEYPRVALSQADEILSLIDKSFMLSNGEIPVVANPQWSLESYVAYMSERGCV